MSAESSARSPIPEEEDPTLVASRPAPTSTIRPSEPVSLEPRDTIVDPQPVPWRRRVADILLLLPICMGRLIAREWRAFWQRFAEPPLTDLLPPPPMMPRREGIEPLTHDQIAEQLVHNLFRLPSRYTRGALRIARLAYDNRHAPREERLDLRVWFVVSRLAQSPSEPIAIGSIRQRLPDVHRTELNASLGRMAKECWIELINEAADDEGIVAQGVAGPDRRWFTHIRVLSWL